MNLFVKARIYILFFFFLFVVAGMHAQEIKKEIIVVNPYKPTLSDVEKLGVVPTMSDTAKITTSYKYNVLPSRVDIPFNLRPIKPARMVGVPQAKLYKSYIKLGMGNYLTPLAEFSISNLRSKDHVIGADISHKSSHSKLKLENEHKVPAGYKINKVKVYGTKFYRDASLSGNLSYTSDGVYYYGYNTALFPDTLPEIEKKNIEQQYSVAGAQVRLNSTRPDSSKFFYDLGIKYSFLGDNYRNSEHNFKADASFSQLIQGFNAGLDVGYQLISPNNNLDSLSKKILSIHPFVSKSGYEWKIQVGLNTFTEFNSSGSRTRFYPTARFDLVVIPDNIITAFFGIDGYLEPVYYHKITGENPFIKPGLNVMNANHKLIGYAGLNGSFSSDAGFRFDIRYSKTDNQHFYVNDTTSELQNQFVVAYDNEELVKYHGEIYYYPMEKLQFKLNGSYYSYTLGNELKPWHKPEFDLTFSTRYNMQDKILLNIDVIGTGKRYARLNGETEPFKEMKGFVDINLGVEYRYSKILSAFINIYNLSSGKYEMWNQYPAQRLNFIAGFTYKL